MKRRLLLVLSALSLFSFSAAYAQGELDAYKLSRNDLKGTARSVAMGGAFGALGGDVSAISINPAGIGVYKSSEVVTTLSFKNTKAESNILGNKLDDKKFSVKFDNFAFVSNFPTMSDVVPLINVGFSYNRLKSFDRKYRMQGIGADDGSGIKGTLVDYMALRANDFGYAAGDINTRRYGNLSNGEVDKQWQNRDWLSLLAYNSFLINDNGTTMEPAIDLYPDSYLSVKEKGSINSYDFNIGTTISDMLSVGLTVSVTDIDYKMTSLYGEDFWDGDKRAYFDLENSLKTEGTGWQVATGFIFKPVEALRIGVAYHSPTWYKMTDRFSAWLDHDLRNIIGMPGQSIDKYKNGTVASYDEFYNGVYDYELRTPDKWTFSLAGVIGQTAIISADYELTNYKNMKLHDDNGNNYYITENDDSMNNYIKRRFKVASTLRLGTEIRITPQFSGRVGYAWQQSGIEKEFKNNKLEAHTTYAAPHFVLEGDIHNITWGLGYRFTKNVYTDIAFVYSTQKDYLYGFTNAYNDAGKAIVVADRADLKTNAFQGLLTFGVRW